MEDGDQTATEQTGNYEGSWMVPAELAGEFIPESGEFILDSFVAAAVVALIWLLVVFVCGIAKDLSGGPPQSLFGPQ